MQDKTSLTRILNCIDCASCQYFRPFSIERYSDGNCGCVDSPFCLDDYIDTDFSCQNYKPSSVFLLRLREDFELKEGSDED